MSRESQAKRPDSYTTEYSFLFTKLENTLILWQQYPPGLSTMPKLADYFFLGKEALHMSAKPFKTYADQLQSLQDRGLAINDPVEAEHILKHFNYYRLSAYRFPFQQDQDQFISGTTFDDLWELYQFDRKLRHLVSEACKSLEISVRARWAYVLSEAHGSQAYEDASLFADPTRHTQHLHSIDRELERSHEVFIQHYRDEYGMPRPPIWAATEVMSFGLLSRFYENIRQASLKKAVAKTYDLSPQVLGSLLTHTTYLRNLCAHHSRLWNRSFTITLTLPNRNPRDLVSSLDPDLTNRRIYNSLALLVHISNIVHQNDDWKERLKAHLLTLQRPDHSEMGFPNDWQDRFIWKHSHS
ncbi:MAG: abortive infection bacteriophage resistance protein [Rubritalea sp.]